MKRRIACFIGELFRDYQSKLYKGIEAFAKKNDVVIDIFTNFGVFAGNYLHTLGETNIASIPDLKKYDGILIAPDTLTVENMREDVIARLIEGADCPIVSVRTERDEFPNIIIDDRETMEAIVEHFFEHGLTKIYYMSGIEGMKDAQIRLAGYRSVMERHGIEVTEHMVFHGDYWTTKGHEAVEWFLGGGEVPEAIVCANDYMAIAVIEELRQRGYRVPEDIKVSGYDDIAEGNFFLPKLATAEIPAALMGERSLEVLAELMDGKKVPKNTYVKARTIMCGTCGCKVKNANEFAGKCFANYTYLRDCIHRSISLNVDFENCDTFDDVLKDATNFSQSFGHSEMYVCLCVDEDEEDKSAMGEYTEKMRLAGVISKKNGYSLKDEIFNRVDILPEKYRVDDPVITIFPIHFRGHCMGYLAVKLEESLLLGEGFVMWANSLSNYLDKINMYERNKLLLKYREESNMDGLTGIYNRRGMDMALTKAISKAEDNPGFYIICLDMDGLKYINDTYGHNEGDYALKKVGTVLRSLSSAKIVTGRTGGDEFIVSVLGCETDVKLIIQKIKSKLAKKINHLGHSYEISISAGYAKYDERKGLTDCINKADKKMYAEKATHHHVRR